MKSVEIKSGRCICKFCDVPYLLPYHQESVVQCSSPTESDVSNCSSRKKIKSIIGQLRTRNNDCLEITIRPVYSICSESTVTGGQESVW